MNIPNRPGLIIRAPCRDNADKSNMDSSLGSGVSDDVMKRVLDSSQNKTEVVIYTNSGVCPFSEDLVNLSQRLGINIQRIDVSHKTPPSWLPGTPSVVYHGNVYCGDAAFGFIESLENPTTEVVEEKPNNMTLGSIKEKSVGCGISAAFAPPVNIQVDESLFDMNTDDAMQKMLQSRR